MQGRMRRAYQVLRALQSALCAMLWGVDEADPKAQTLSDPDETI